MERLVVAEAARRLGVTPEAIRQRIGRDPLKHDKDEDGRLYVYLDPDTTPSQGWQGKGQAYTTPSPGNTQGYVEQRRS